MAWGLSLNFLVRGAFRGTPRRDEAARPQQYFSRVVPAISFRIPHTILEHSYSKDILIYDSYYFRIGAYEYSIHTDLNG